MREVKVFHIQGCGPCAQMRQALKKHKSKAKSYRVDQAGGKEAMKYDVRAVPTTLFIEDDVVKSTKVGYNKMLATQIEEYLNGCN